MVWWLPVLLHSRLLEGGSQGVFMLCACVHVCVCESVHAYARVDVNTQRAPTSSGLGALGSFPHTFWAFKLGPGVPSAGAPASQ
jgi:hypothetical protein